MPTFLPQVAMTVAITWFRRITSLLVENAPRASLCTPKQQSLLSYAKFTGHSHSVHVPHGFASIPSGGDVSTGPLPTSVQFVLSAVPLLS